MKISESIRINLLGMLGVNLRGSCLTVDLDVLKFHSLRELAGIFHALANSNIKVSSLLSFSEKPDHHFSPKPGDLIPNDGDIETGYIVQDAASESLDKCSSTEKDDLDLQFRKAREEALKNLEAKIDKDAKWMAEDLAAEPDKLHHHPDVGNTLNINKDDLEKVAPMPGYLILPSNIGEDESKDQACKRICKSIMNGHTTGCPYAGGE